MRKDSIETMKQIGARLLLLRKQKHMTQAALAEALGISPKHMGCVERGESILSIEKLIDTCNYFDVTLDYLIRGYGDPSRENHEMPLAFVELFMSAEESERLVMYEYMKMYLTIRKEQTLSAAKETD